jgi:hypothetical protein
MRSHRLTLTLVLIALLSAPQLRAGTKEFHDVLNTVEHNCGIHHVRMPFVNMFVNLGMKLSDDQEMKQMKDIHFAVFNVAGANLPHCTADLQERISDKLGPEWIPFVRIHSKDQREDVVIYLQNTESEPKMIVAAIDAEDAAVVQVRFTREALSKWVNQEGAVHRRHRTTPPLDY